MLGVIKRNITYIFHFIGVGLGLATGVLAECCFSLSEPVSGGVHWEWKRKFLELSFLGANVPGSESSRERKFLGAKVPVTYFAILCELYGYNVIE